jgi:5S rRNA maturation endonuclease (ribonuclease M5)
VIADDLLERLDKVRKTPKGWQACCPAHEDRNPSLSITEAGDKILLKCFAGCEVDAICAALGVATGELFADAPKGVRKGGARPSRAAQSVKRSLVDTYVYYDEAGAELYRIDRLENGTGKTFRQYRMIGGKRDNSLGDVRRVLWRLPMLATVEDVCIVEGEKCVNALESIGIQSTTNSGGANGWRDEFADSLKGKHVWVMPDMDNAGADWLELVTDSFHKRDIDYHIACMPEGINDVADLIAADNAPKGALCAITKILCHAERENVTLEKPVMA